MRILLDANLSYPILKKIEPRYPDAKHVSRIPLPHPANDPDIWRWARDNDFAIIVSNDRDFKELVEKNGPPPKLIYLRLGNVDNTAVSSLLMEKHERITQFLNHPEKDILEIFAIAG